MAVPVPSIRDVKIGTRASVAFLSKIVGETQVDFVSETVNITLFNIEFFNNFSANFENEYFVKLSEIFVDVSIYLSFYSTDSTVLSIRLHKSATKTLAL